MLKPNYSVLVPFVFFLFLIQVSGATTPDTQKTETQMFTLETPPYQIQIDENGFQIITIDGYERVGMPDEPALPRRVYFFAVPPEAILDSARLEIFDIRKKTLDGTIPIQRAMPDMPSGGNPEVWDIPSSRAKGNHLESNDLCHHIRLLHAGQMRKWRFLRIEFSPFCFDPSSGRLSMATEITGQVRYSLDPQFKSRNEDLLADSVMDDAAQRILINYEQAKEWYGSLNTLANNKSTYDYVIITTNAIVSNSARLSDFVDHKTQRGHSVLIITEYDYGSLTGQLPNGTAEKIRKWLQDNYVSYSIKYVLLIGDPDPDDPSTGSDSVGDVPMKMCWPRFPESTYRESPTDYFYADLTGNWDVDGDLYYGEYTDDFGVTGGVDFAHEVVVGRIPVYGADYTTLDDILQKCITFDNDTGAGWRKSSLLPMSFSSSTYDGSPLAEQMMDDYLDNAGFSSWTQYQQGNGACSLNSIYVSSEELRGGTVVRDRWAGGDYGLVLWWGHGSQTSVSVGSSGCWDGTLFNTTYAANLDDAHPSFVYQNSCTNGYPEHTGNLQYTLLTHGAVATVGATRVSWYNSGVGYGDFDGSTTNSGIGYEYASRIVQGLPGGDALFEAKWSMTPSSSTRLMNYYDFNLYGDPGMSVPPDFGDFDGSYTVDACDLSILINFLCGNIKQNGSLLDMPQDAADLDLSGVVDALDLMIMADYLSGNIDVLPWI